MEDEERALIRNRMYYGGNALKTIGAFMNIDLETPKYINFIFFPVYEALNGQILLAFLFHFKCIVVRRD